ncbi:MAG: RNA polymerase sigma factor, partial [Candidatus Poribacteria bacterium]
VGDNETTQDLSQDVFVRLWVNADTYLPVAKFTTFLWTIAKNICLNALARAKNTPYIQSLDEISSEEDCEFIEYLPSKENSPEDNLIGMETEKKLIMAINRLSPDHRLVFILTELNGLSYQEVANIMQCPVGTVASRKNNAIKALRRYLAPLIG